jgi:hypothetical protein
VTEVPFELGILASRELVLVETRPSIERARAYRRRGCIAMKVSNRAQSFARRGGS